MDLDRFSVSLTLFLDQNDCMEWMSGLDNPRIARERMVCYGDPTGDLGSVTDIRLLGCQ